MIQTRTNVRNLQLFVIQTVGPEQSSHRPQSTHGGPWSTLGGPRNKATKTRRFVQIMFGLKSENCSLRCNKKGLSRVTLPQRTVRYPSGALDKYIKLQKKKLSKCLRIAWKYCKGVSRTREETNAPRWGFGHPKLNIWPMPRVGKPNVEKLNVPAQSSGTRGQNNYPHKQFEIHAS